MDKKAYKTFKERFPSTVQFAAILTLVVILICVILFLFESVFLYALYYVLMSPFIGILYFILIVAFMSVIVSIASPLIYSYFASNVVLGTPKAENANIRNFLRTYSIGCRAPIKGQLHVFSNLIYTILIMLGLMILVSGIGFAIVYNKNYLDFATLFDQTIDVYTEYIVTGSESSLTQLNELLNNENLNTAIQIPLLLGNYVGLLGGLYFFIHRINLNVFKYYIANTFHGVNPRGCKEIYRRGLSKIKGKFYKDYYGTLYPLTITFVVVLTLAYWLLGSLVSIFVSDMFVLDLIVVIIVSVIMLPLMPVAFNLYDDMRRKYQSSFMDAFLSLAELEMSALKENTTRMQQMRAQDMEMMEKNLEAFKKQVNDIKENMEKQNEDDVDPEFTKEDDEIIEGVFKDLDESNKDNGDKDKE